VNLQVVELRQYTLFGGRRTELTRLFLERFVHTQNAVGAQVLGAYIDVEDPDRFVWLRGFCDMGQRREALQRFYEGETWAVHRPAATATMVDSDNVLLLKPALQPAWPPSAAPLIRLAVQPLLSTEPAAFATFFEHSLKPLIEGCGARVVCTLLSETAHNDYPRLPVRVGPRYFLWRADFADSTAEATFSERLHALSGWRDALDEALLPALMCKSEVLRLRAA
jgi:hypothetical protein